MKNPTLNYVSKATLIFTLRELTRISGVFSIAPISRKFEKVSLDDTIAMKYDASQSLYRTSPIAKDTSDAIQRPEQAGQHTEWESDAAMQLSVLTPRQHQIMDLILTGKPSKNIATDLGISRRTVENHRAAIMRKTGSKSIPALARLAFMPKVTVPLPVSFLNKLSLV